MSLPLSRLSADHNCSHVFSCHLSFSHFLPAHLNSSLFSSSQLLHSMQLVSTQLFPALHHSFAVRSSGRIPCHLISAYFPSCHIFTALSGGCDCGGDGGDGGDSDTGDSDSVDSDSGKNPLHGSIDF